MFLVVYFNQAIIFNLISTILFYMPLLTWENISNVMENNISNVMETLTIQKIELKKQTSNKSTVIVSVIYCKFIS